MACSIVYSSEKLETTLMCVHGEMAIPWNRMH